MTPPQERNALPRRSAGVVLVIDYDRDIGELVEAVLSDAGYTVSCLYQMQPEVIQAAVGRLEPDCVLLDGSEVTDYGHSWEAARQLHVRERPVPVVMFTTNVRAVEEARAEATRRSRAAGLSAVIAKPFDLEELLDAVAIAVGQSAPFDWSPQADAARTQALVERLRAGGARDIHRSTRREWVTFRAPSGSTVQVYWWQAAGGYYCGAYQAQGSVMQRLGFFPSLDAAVECALSS